MTTTTPKPGTLALPPGYGVAETASREFGSMFTATGPDGHVLGSCSGGKTAKARAREMAFAHFGRRASEEISALLARNAELVAALKDVTKALGAIVDHADAGRTVTTWTKAGGLDVMGKVANMNGAREALARAALAAAEGKES